jgi:hypothetical protein
MQAENYKETHLFQCLDDWVEEMLFLLSDIPVCSSLPHPTSLWQSNSFQDCSTMCIGHSSLREDFVSVSQYTDVSRQWLHPASQPSYDKMPIDSNLA